MIKCSNGHDNPDNAVFCRICGKKMKIKVLNTYTPDKFPDIKLFPKSVKRQIFTRPKDRAAFILAPVFYIGCFLFFEVFDYEISREIGDYSYTILAVVLSILTVWTAALMLLALVRLCRKIRYSVAVDYIEDSADTIRRVAKECKLGLYNEKNKKLLLWTRYDMIVKSASAKGYYTITKDGKKGLYEVEKSKMIVPVKYDVIQDIKDGIVTVSRDGEVYHYDVYGNRLK